jgi:hypothetical protein
MIQLEENFDGHIILYCKSHYSIKNVDFIVGLQRIWAVRCGISIEYVDNSLDEYIADRMYEIFAKCKPKKLPYFHQIFNKGLADDWTYGDLKAIDRAIMIYANELSMLQIKDLKLKNYVTLIELPKPQKRLFKRIVSGKGTYGDYDKVK